MSGAPLDVEEPHPLLAHEVDEFDERDLRRVPLNVEHRFAAEEAVDAHAVESARESSVAVERLDAVRPAEIVQSGIRGDEIRVDPAVGAGGIGTGANDVVETRVDAYLVARRASP